MNNKRVVITGYGIVSCIGNNKEEVLDKIKKGQKFVRENYELNIIGKKWEKVYENIISNIL